MSKKAKGKAGDPLNNYNPEEWPKDEEARKRTWLDAMYTQQHVQHRLNVLENDNVKLKTRQNNLRSEKDSKYKVYEERIAQYTKQINSLELENEQQKEKINKLEEEFAKYMEDTTNEMNKLNDDNKKERDSDGRKIRELEKQLQDSETFKSKKEEYDMRLSQLERDLEAEKKKKQVELGEKEREKIQATENLRKEMLYKIKETKANLLALNDEQLQTTTRLTILQNHQLTTELEYQSKQTEQLLARNHKMKTKIETLNREIQIHKEVEKELAKRSHFCQKVIKKLKQQVKDLEASKQEMKSHRYETQRNNFTVGPLSGSASARRIGQHAPSKSLMNSQELVTAKQNDDLINFLEHKLEEIEKKLSRTQIEYESLQQDYLEVQEKMQGTKEKYKRAALLLTEFLDDLLNQTPNILNTDKDMHLNLDKLKETPFEHLEKEDKVALVLVLLKQLQPYLSTHNLSTATVTTQPFSPRDIGVLNQSMDGKPMIISPRNQHFVSSKTDQVLQDHNASGTQAEVDALHSILNNINVQHQNRASMTTKNQLPPI